MKSTLKYKPVEVFAGFADFIKFLTSKGIRSEVVSEEYLSTHWSDLEQPLSSDAIEVTSKNFAFHLKGGQLTAPFGLVFRDIKKRDSKKVFENEVYVDFPEAALDLLLRKIAHPEWAGPPNFLSHYSSQKIQAEEGVVMGPDCQIGEGVILEAGVRIGARVQIGEGTRIGAGSRIADDTIIGKNCYFRGPVSIGGHGFGFIPYPGSPLPKHRLHVGTVLIGDSVQLGSFVAIDRGVLEDTVIGSSTAMDNVVQIGHNCKTGKHNILCGFVGLAGSTILGDYVTFGGLVVTKGHLKVGDRVQVGGFSGIVKDVEAGALLRGIPARPIKRDLKIMAIQEKLPELYALLKNMTGSQLSDLSKETP